MSTSAFELYCPSQQYDWGKLGSQGSKVSQFSKHIPGFVVDDDKPYAELWMGTHPSAPSKTPDGTFLKDIVQKDPKAYLGEKVTAKFGDDLPFLFKVLAIRKALSIQAHPDKTLAKHLRATLPQHYKDDNHKPEMAIALTPFNAFCGFRPVSEIAAFAKEIPELRKLVSEKRADAFVAAVDSGADTKEALTDFFSAIMRDSENQAETLVAALVSRVSQGTDLSDKSLAPLIKTLNTDFPGDIGIFCVYCLNIVSLNPGEAIFLKANEPHAYLDGDIIECMAASDNVVRAGLTPKFRDVDTLVSMLTYKSASVKDQILPPQIFRSATHTLLYNPPIDEFSVLQTKLAKGESDTIPPIDGPSILIVSTLAAPTDIKYTGASSGTLSAQYEGQVYFIAPGTEVSITAPADFVAYRAFVEV